MASSATDSAVLSPNLRIWHRYDPSIKADLFSTALMTQGGIFLIDPISFPAAMLQEITMNAAVAGIVLTNANHDRAAAELAELLSVPIYKSGNIPQLPPDLRVIDLAGAAPDEIALHSTRDGGTVVIGDALINFGSHGFTFLPAKYSTNAKLMRKSLRQLLDLEFNAMLFAHGEPIMSGARDRLVTLLDAGC